MSMFNKLKLSNEEKEKSNAFINWCLDNKKDLFKMAFDKEYMKKSVNEYKGEMENENKSIKL